MTHGKKLRSGFTTGVCAAAAAKAAARMLLTQKILREVSIRIPSGITLTLTLSDVFHLLKTPHLVP
jgi:cobalt-precorrin-5B (C1)-methyltransferase